MSIAVGDVAPDFTLPGVRDGQRGTWTLSAARGRPVILAFYPGDDTTVCTRQLCSYNDELAQFADLGAELWGLSPQGLESHEAFAAKRGLAFPLLADVDREVGRAYGLVSAGLYRRTVVVVDGAGTVAWVHRALVGLTFRSVDEVAAAVRAAR